MNSNKIAIVIGGNGFIGSEVVSALKKNSISCVSVIRKDCNLLAFDEVKQYFLQYKTQNLDIIFTASIVRRKNDSGSASEDNILMIKNFIKATYSHQINSFIFLSSIDVYHNNSLSLNESTKLLPNKPYSISKLSSEIMLKKVFKDKLIILRMPGVYGINDKNGSIIGKFTKLIKNNTELKLFSKGLQYRDYLYVEDIPKVIISLMEGSFSGIFNLSTGKSIRLVEIIKIISKELGQAPLIKESLEDLPLLNITVSNKKFLDAFPNFSFTSMELGIKKFIQGL